MGRGKGVGGCPKYGVWSLGVLSWGCGHWEVLSLRGRGVLLGGGVRSLVEMLFIGLCVCLLSPKVGTNTLLPKPEKRVVRIKLECFLVLCKHTCAGVHAFLFLIIISTITLQSV